MKEFVTRLFSEKNSELHIDLFNIWHLLYLFIIIEGTIILALVFNNKSSKAQEKILRLFAYLTIGFYIADFFIMPLSDSYSGISIDKLPFHICTLMGVFAAFVQFNPKFKPIKSTIVVLSIAGTIMWMCYPGSALGGEPPFCYKIFQTFMYHGFLFCWGVLNLAFRKVKLSLKNLWHEAVAVVGLILWAFFGNTVYPNDQNWLFINHSIFSFLKDEYMIPVVWFCITGTCFLVYCAYYLVLAITNKHHKNLDKKEHTKEAIEEKVEVTV